MIITFVTNYGSEVYCASYPVAPFMSKTKDIIAEVAVVQTVYSVVALVQSWNFIMKFVLAIFGAVGNTEGYVLLEQHQRVCVVK